MARASTPAVVPPTGNEAKPYKEQIKFLGCHKPYFGFISGSGAGKTFAGAYRLRLNAEKWNRGEMGAIIVPDKSQFTDNIKPILEDFGVMDSWDYNSVYTDEPGLVTSNGDRILILSADNERQIGRIKGKNLAYVWMDEEAEIPKRARQIADQRLRVGDYPNLFITTTPDGKNHTYDFFKGNIESSKEYSHGRATIIEGPDHLAVTAVPSEANPVLNDDDIARMRRNTPDQIEQQELDGKFVQVGGNLLTTDMLDVISPEAWDDRTDTWKWHVGVDIGVSMDKAKARANDTDYWAVSVVAEHPLHAEAYVLDIARERGQTPAQAAEWLAGLMDSIPTTKCYIESVHAQRWFLQDCKEVGLNPIPVDQTRKKEDRLLYLSVPFSNGSVKLVDGVDWSDFRQEWAAFPDGNHDDQLDSLELALRHTDLKNQLHAESMDPYHDGE